MVASAAPRLPAYTLYFKAYFARRGTVYWGSVTVYTYGALYMYGAPAAVASIYILYIRAFRLCTYGIFVCTYGIFVRIGSTYIIYQWAAHVLYISACLLYMYGILYIGTYRTAVACIHVICWRTSSVYTWCIWACIVYRK